MGVKAPIIREGDDLKRIVIESIDNVLNENGMTVKDGDIIGITESVVARAQGNYVTIDDIVQFMDEHGFNKNLVLYSPIMSRNRFAMILKAFARYADNIKIAIYDKVDEVGNPTMLPNPFTGVDVMKYYKEICDSENCYFSSVTCNKFDAIHEDGDFTKIDCRCHTTLRYPDVYTLANIMDEPIKRKDGTISGYNADWGLLGSNKADEETLKLFPQKDKAQTLVNEIQTFFKENVGAHVEVLVYGDGCFKSPEKNGVSIWEFADPTTEIALTSGLNRMPNEIKVKALADDKYKNLKGEELENAIKKEIRNKQSDLKNNMLSQGTTPRHCVDLIVSLMDLISGSGDRCTPFVFIRNYFNNNLE